MDQQEGNGLGLTCSRFLVDEVDLEIFHLSCEVVPFRNLFLGFGPGVLVLPIALQFVNPLQ